MPSLNDIASVAEALEKSAVSIVQDRCVVVRNRNATCRLCEGACAASAIEVVGNEVVYDAHACMSCGACSIACPTEAIAFSSPTDSELAESAATGVIACARIAAKRQADPSSYAEVPCLARVDESVLLELAADGRSEILLVDGNCPTCKLRDCAAHAEKVIEDAARLIDAQRAATRIRRTTGFPVEMHAEDPSALHGTTRRGFFSDAVGAARDTALAAAQTTLASELGYARATPAIGERLRVTEAGTLPLIRVVRHERAIDALYELGEPSTAVIESRLFGSVEIAPAKCNACGMCAVFCPTGALRRDPVPKAGEPLESIEFSASDCVRCGLCADVCWKGALTLSPGVSATQLFDFEPVVFDLADVKRAGCSMFGHA